MKTIRTARGRIMREAPGDSRTLRAVLSTGEVALDGHTIDPNGWIVPDSKSVPLIDSHNDAAGIRTVLGRVTNIRAGSAPLASGRTATCLLGILDFAPPTINPDAEVAYQLYLAGYANSVSVSFVPIEWDYANKLGRAPGAMDISAARLLEASLVGVPSDDNARVLARAVRAELTGDVTNSDRRALARAIYQRIAREDEAAGFGYLHRGAKW
ncbi:MAG: hypothetical protein ACRD3Q_02985 [Terriglobales bacterium]